MRGIINGKNLVHTKELKSKNQLYLRLVSERGGILSKLYKQMWDPALHLLPPTVPGAEFIHQQNK